MNRRSQLGTASNQALQPGWRVLLRPILIVGLYLLGWYLLDLIALRFETAPEIFVWYPPAALDLVLLLVFGLRFWPALLFNPLIHTYFVTGRPLAGDTLLFLDLITTFGYTSACLLLLYRLRINPQLRSTYDVAWFVGIAAVGAPLLIAGLQAINFAWSGLIPWREALLRTMQYWAGHATGIAMLTPVLLIALRRRPTWWAIPKTYPHPRHPLQLFERRSLIELCLEVALTLVTVWIAYGTTSDPTLDYRYIVFIPLIVIAIRHGFERTALLVLVINVLVAILVVPRIQETNGLALQFGLMTVTLTGIVLGSLMSDRQRTVEALQTSERRFRHAFHDAAIGMVLVAPEGLFLQVNQAFCSMVGYTKQELLATSFQTITHPDDLTLDLDYLQQALAGTISSYHLEKRYVHKRGHILWASLNVSLVSSPNGGPRYFISQIQDITRQKTLQNDMIHQVFHDTLTGLPNRGLFMDRLQHALRRAARHPGAPAIIFLDLDNFKVINDSLGHPAGDQLLIEVAARLQQCVRSGDTCARFGGDEFMLLVEDDSSGVAATEVAQRIITNLQTPFDIASRSFVVTASLGIAVSIEGESNADDLLRRADMAMFQVKGKGKSGYQIFDASLNTLAQERLELEADLRIAIEHGELRLFYQPIIDVEAGHLLGFEALVRWAHPRRGLLVPATFIPIAEETGLIIPLGLWVLKEACRQTQTWHLIHSLQPALGVSVNLSALQFQHTGLVTEITQILQTSGLLPSCLMLEVTESVSMQDAETTAATLLQLKSLGVRVAIDDFGTGYSSLAYLSRFPLDTIKIDRSFVTRIGQRPEDTTIVRSICTLAKEMGLHVTAEGIETAEALQLMQQLGCDYAQGYFFAPPLPADEADALIMEQSLLRTI